MKRLHAIFAFLFVLALVAAPLSPALAATDAQEEAHKIAEEGHQAAEHYAETTGEAMDEAAEEAIVAHSGTEEHHIPWMNYTWRVINFIIFLFIIWKFAGSKISDVFGGRKKQIKTDLEDLEARKTEASKKLSEVEKSIANIQQEKAAILDEAKQQAEDIKESIIAKANESAEQIKAQAKMTAENETRAEVDKVRAQMADLVVEAARKMMDEKLDKASHEKLVDEYLTKVVLN